MSQPQEVLYILIQCAKNTAIYFQDTAINFIDSVMPSKPLKLKYTIKLIKVLTFEIDGTETAIKQIVNN